MYLGLDALGPKMDQGLPALKYCVGPKMYIGHAALGTFLYLGLSAVFTQGLQIMTSVITQYSSFVQPLQACKDSTLLDVNIIYC